MSKPSSRRTSGSDLKRVDAHVVQPAEYEELPELTDEMLVIARWKATGPGWQTRMAKRLERMPLPRGNP